jgi:hypothetical protein
VAAVEPDFEKLGIALHDQGFNSIQISKSGEETLFIRYENRVYRNEVLAAGIVLATVANNTTDSIRVVLAPHQNQVPVGCVSVAISDYRRFISGALDASQFSRLLDFSEFDAKSMPLERSFQSRSIFPAFDLTIYPNFMIQFGNYDDAIKLNFGIAPELSLDLGKGASLSGRVQLPLYDEIRIYSLQPRLTRVILSHSFYIRQAGWFFTKVGIFEPDRWGLAGEWARFLFNRQLLVGLKGEYTGFFLHQEGKMNYSSWQTGTGQIYATYFAPKYDLFVRLAYDKYLFSEHGPSVMVSRKFADLEIGLLAAKTNMDEFGGLMLRVPLSPQRSTAPQRLRMKLPEYHTWRYSSTSQAHTQGQTVQTGVTVTTGTESIEWFNFFIPSYIKNNISLWRIAARMIQTEEEK